MLAQRPIMVIGKYRNASGDANITLRGVGGQGEQEWSFRLQEAPASDATLPQPRRSRFLHPNQVKIKGWSGGYT